MGGKDIRAAGRCDRSVLTLEEVRRGLSVCGGQVYVRRLVGGLGQLYRLDLEGRASLQVCTSGRSCAAYGRRLGYASTFSSNLIMITINNANANLLFDLIRTTSLL